jgi:hypothetical protein
MKIRAWITEQFWEGGGKATSVSIQFYDDQRRLPPWVIPFEVAKEYFGVIIDWLTTEPQDITLEMEGVYNK